MKGMPLSRLALCLVLPILLAGIVSWRRAGTSDFDTILAEESSSPALELLQRGARIVHKVKAEEDVGVSATTKTTTASAFGIGANGVGNLPTFLTGLCTDACVIILCVIIFVWGAGRYPILFGAGNMRPTTVGDSTEQAMVSQALVDKMKDHIDPKTKLPASRTWLGFARVSWSLDYEDIAEAAGLDKAMLIMFVDKCCNAFKWIAIPMFWITGPLNCFFGGNAAGEDHESWFSLGNVQFYSWLYWVTGFACCYVAYIVCNKICIAGMIEFQQYRKNWLLTMDSRRSRTLMLIGIPEDYQNEARCKLFWNELTNNKVESVYISKDVDARMPEDDGSFRKLADSPFKAYTLAQMVAKRDALKIARDAASVDMKAAEAARQPVPQSTQDAFKQSNDDITQLNKDIETMRKWTNERANDTTGQYKNNGRRPNEELSKTPENYIRYPVNLETGFITFTDRVTCEMALHMNLGSTWHEWVVEKAPEPVDIIWADMTEDSNAGGARALLGYLLTAGVMIIYMPLVVLIANLAEAINLGPFQMLWSSEAPSIGLTIMVDFLPTILVLIFTNCFSVYDLSNQQYKLTVWYFWMNILFVVLVTALGTSFMSFVKTLANDPLKIFHLFATTMPNCTHYYMNYLGMQWYSMAMQLTRYMNVIKYRIFIRHHEEEEARSLSEPEDQDYYGIGSRTARFSTLVTIGIVYGTLSPPCSVLAWLTVLWIRTLFGYIFVFNETKKPDLGGAFFQRALHNMYIALHVYFILMLGVLYIRGNDSGPAIIAACGWVYVFYSQNKFNKYKWQDVEVDKCKHADSSKTRVLHGRYMQPEMYDADKPESKSSGTAQKVADVSSQQSGILSGIFGRRADGK